MLVKKMGSSTASKHVFPLGAAILSNVFSFISLGYVNAIRDFETNNFTALLARFQFTMSIIVLSLAPLWPLKRTCAALLTISGLQSRSRIRSENTESGMPRSVVPGLTFRGDLRETRCREKVLYISGE